MAETFMKCLFHYYMVMVSFFFLIRYPFFTSSYFRSVFRYSLLFQGADFDEEFDAANADCDVSVEDPEIELNIREHLKTSISDKVVVTIGRSKKNQMEVECTTVNMLACSATVSSSKFLDI